MIAGVDETVLPPGCRDRQYLEALDALLQRMPDPDLVFVIAGGDVLEGDHLGHLGLTMEGARRRDLRVAREIAGVPSVWLPGGGYHARAWQVLAGTVLAVTRHARQPIVAREDPMAVRLPGSPGTSAPKAGRSRPWQTSPSTMWGSNWDWRHGAAGTLLLGFYTAETIEFATYRFGLLAFLERRGYGLFRVELGTASTGGERVSVYGAADGVEHLLGDAVFTRRQVAGEDVLYVEWLTLRDPRARFSAKRPRLPGQEVPGLGLAREVAMLLNLAARRIGATGVAFAPAHYHTAYASRGQSQFVDPVRQGRFEAMLRDFREHALAQVSEAFEAGRVLMNGQPHAWEPSEMVTWLHERPVDRAAVEAERDQVRFDLAPAPDVAGTQGAASE